VIPAVTRSANSEVRKEKEGMNGILMLSSSQ
jgi:hypothetical protein